MKSKCNQALLSRPIAVTTTMVSGLDLQWGSGSPAERINPDFFVSRITFYLQIVTARSYTFFLGSDDSSK